ncbi:hypothetical protein ABZS29_19045 [Kribbella sp. NPDC005582]|uniref:tetratricopeptide repeat protein n=1 Tax=Kribbella sp. NPDC005582 TaxID=3156893 RepID=UPI0033A679E9
MNRSPMVALRNSRRLQAGVAALLVALIGLGWLRYDAGRINHAVDAARAAGDCGQVAVAQERYGFGHRIAAWSLVTEAEDVKVCGRLADAGDQMDKLFAGDLQTFARGFRTLNTTLDDPDQQAPVGVALDKFLRKLPGNRPCATVEVAEWLNDRKPLRTPLDRTYTVIHELEPAALLKCATETMDQVGTRDQAEVFYERLVKRYPANPLVAKAKTALAAIDRQKEQEEIVDLISRSDSDPEAYCNTPVGFSQAAPYGRGVNQAVVVGGDDRTAMLPTAWQATVHASCIESPSRGEVARTGRLVIDTKIQVSGSVCPDPFRYRGKAFEEPPRHTSVVPTEASVAAAFRPLIVKMAG